MTGASMMAVYGTLMEISKYSAIAFQKPAMSVTDQRHNSSYDVNTPMPRRPSHAMNLPMFESAIDSGVGVHRGAPDITVAPSLLGDHRVLEDTQLVDLDPNCRTRIEATRGVHHEPHPCGRAGGNDGAGQQRERGRQVGDELPAVGDHLLGRRVLAQIAVDPCTDREIVWIADLIRTDQPRTDGAMRVPRLAHGHRRRGPLPIANGHIVDNEVTGHD